MEKLNQRAEFEPAADQPVAWIIPGDDNAYANGALDARISQEGEFTRPLYARPAPPPPAEPVAYRLDYTAGKVEAFHLTTPGLLQLDIQGLHEDGRENIRSTPLYRHAQPPGALLPGLRHAVEIIESIETPADQYEPYKSRLVDALCDAIHSAATKEVKP